MIPMIPFEDDGRSSRRETLGKRMSSRNLLEQPFKPIIGFHSDQKLHKCAIS